MIINNKYLIEYHPNNVLGTDNDTWMEIYEDLPSTALLATIFTSLAFYANKSSSNKKKK